MLLHLYLVGVAPVNGCGECVTIFPFLRVSDQHNNQIVVFLILVEICLIVGLLATPSFSHVGTSVQSHPWPNVLDLLQGVS